MCGKTTSTLSVPMQRHQIMRGIHLYFMWKIQKCQYMWKVHIISTFFSESAGGKND